MSKANGSEMDHSENEDYTMSSPLPGKKVTRETDSDLVRVRYLVGFYNKLQEWLNSF